MEKSKLSEAITYFSALKKSETLNGKLSFDSILAVLHGFKRQEDETTSTQGTEEMEKQILAIIESKQSHYDKSYGAGFDYLSDGEFESVAKEIASLFPSKQAETLSEEEFRGIIHDNFKRLVRDCHDPDYKEAIDTICHLSIPKAENEWISVDERLPEIDVRGISNTVIGMIFGKKQPHEVVYVGINKSWLNYETTVEVTHWMPFPEAPNNQIT